MNSCHEVFATGIELESRRFALRFQLDSGREHSPRDMCSSGTGHCYGGIDDGSPAGRSKGSGYIVVKSKEDVSRCIQSFNGIEFRGRRMDVRES
eukprot:gene15703-biopygen4369